MGAEGLSLQNFNEALSRGVIAVSICSACGRQQVIPSVSCFSCGATQLQMKEHNGYGVIFSWVTCHYPFDAAWQAEVPYIVALVEIDGGGRVYGRLLDVPAGFRLRAELPVNLDASETAAKSYPVFRLRGK
jgi:uncharacterized OB-fold protein